jgi:pyruvate-formate lyase-activating enzyme
MPRSIAFVLPYGEPRDGFFPDGLAGLLCARARALGHRAEVVRVYYHGRDASEDARVRMLLRAWLAEREVDLVVLERLFDEAPIRAHLDDAARGTALLVTRGEPFALEGDAVEWVIGMRTSPTRAGHPRSPEIGELVASFTGFLGRLEDGLDPLGVPGVSRVEQGALRHGPPSSPTPLPRPVRPVITQAVLAPDATPPVRRKTLFGNAGCPYASDPLEAPHYRGVRLPTVPLARLGCSFCSMGGDYQKRPDAQVIEETLEQARTYLEALPEVDELVLSDQHALRYLAPLMEQATGLRPARWLFPARADAFVRERARIEAAIEAARASGHRLEVHLSGFEAFCDRELARYHKGVDRATLLTAVCAMRELSRAHPDVFDHARARGHSLILFNPWTSPEDVAESVTSVREHGLVELFDELGRNRLRLYDGLPITLAAERDGALTARWEDGDEGAGRLKGYATERPWRFLDPRTRALRTLAEGLRQRLGAETEVTQLAAACAWASEPGRAVRDVPAVLEAIERLRALLGRRTGGHHRPAAAVLFAGSCNDGCAACPNRDRALPDDPAALAARIDAARATGLDVVLAGREPSVHPALGALLKRAGGDDRRAVGVVTNGRRFAYRAFSAAAVRAGLLAASVKLFAPDPTDADAIARVEGAHAQALEGLRALRASGLAILEVRAPLHARNLEALPRYAERARAMDADSLFVEVALDAVGLERLEAAADALEQLIESCDASGLPVETAPLEVGTRRFDRLPTARGPKRA